MTVNAGSFAGGCALGPGKPAGSTIPPHMEGPMQAHPHSGIAGFALALLQTHAGLGGRRPMHAGRRRRHGSHGGLRVIHGRGGHENSAKARQGREDRQGQQEVRVEDRVLRVQSTRASLQIAL